MARPENIVSKLSNSIATPKLLIGLQTFVGGAIAMGYTTYHKQEMHRLLETMEEITGRLRSLQQDTKEIDYILRRIRNTLDKVKEKMARFTISTTTEDIDILLSFMNNTFGLAKDAKEKMGKLSNLLHI